MYGYVRVCVCVQELRDHVIIAGYGRAGQLIGQLLSENLIPFVALDTSNERVATGKVRVCVHLCKHTHARVRARTHTHPHTHTHTHTHNENLILFVALDTSNERVAIGKVWTHTHTETHTHAFCPRCAVPCQCSAIAVFACVYVPFCVRLHVRASLYVRMYQHM